MLFGLDSAHGRGESSLGEEAVKAAKAIIAGYTLPPGLLAVLDASPDVQLLLSPDQTILPRSIRK